MKAGWNESIYDVDVSIWHRHRWLEPIGINFHGHWWIWRAFPTGFSLILEFKRQGIGYLKTVEESDNLVKSQSMQPRSIACFSSVSSYPIIFGMNSCKVKFADVHFPPRGRPPSIQHWFSMGWFDYDVLCQCRIMLIYSMKTGSNFPISLFTFFFSSSSSSFFEIFNLIWLIL